MSQKKSIPQDSQKKIPTRSKVSKTATPKPRKVHPSSLHGEKSTRGSKTLSVYMEDGLAEDPQAKIAERAHELFEYRGRVHGYDWEDWLQAEHEILGESPRF